jgi:hypothetical protein
MPFIRPALRLYTQQWSTRRKHRPDSRFRCTNLVLAFFELLLVVFEIAMERFQLKSTLRSNVKDAGSRSSLVSLGEDGDVDSLSTVDSPWWAVRLGDSIALWENDGRKKLQLAQERSSRQGERGGGDQSLCVTSSYDLLDM